MYRASAAFISDILPMANLLVLLGNQPDIPVKCNRDLIMLDVCLTTVIKDKKTAKAILTLLLLKYDFIEK